MVMCVSDAHIACGTISPRQCRSHPRHRTKRTEQHDVCHCSGVGSTPPKWHIEYGRYGETEIAYGRDNGSGEASFCSSGNSENGQWDTWMSGTTGKGEREIATWVKIYYVILACERATFNIMNMCAVCTLYAYLYNQFTCYQLLSSRARIENYTSVPSCARTLTLAHSHRITNSLVPLQYDNID